MHRQQRQIVIYRAAVRAAIHRKRDFADSPRQSSRLPVRQSQDGDFLQLRFQLIGVLNNRLPLIVGNRLAKQRIRTVPNHRSAVSVRRADCQATAVDSLWLQLFGQTFRQVVGDSQSIDRNDNHRILLTRFDRESLRPDLLTNSCRFLCPTTKTIQTNWIGRRDVHGSNAHGVLQGLRRCGLNRPRNHRNGQQKYRVHHPS